MSTFNSAVPSSTQTLVVRKDHAGTSVYVRTEDGGRVIAGIVLERTDAPAIALAILQAADIKDQPFLSAGYAEIAVGNLSRHVSEVERRVRAERAAKEAADREALELEALELYNKVMRSGKDPLSEWLPALQFTRIKYTNIAKAARELHGATK